MGAAETGQRLRTAALGADAGHQNGPVEGAHIGRIAQRGADHDADAAVPLAGVDLRGGVDDRLRDGARPRPRPLDARTFRIGGGRQDEHAAVVIGGSVQQRLQRSEPEVGRCGHRVGRQRRVTRPRLGVGGHGRADVTPLGVGEHQHPGVAQSADRAFEHREPGRTVGLEERHLRLDHGGGTERGDADVAEASQSVGVDGQTPRLQKLRVRVDAQAQWATLGHRTGEALTEPAHRQDPRALCSSCSDITPMSPRMPASMPCTAAEAPCTVVTQGMFIDTAADRIS